MDALTRHLKKIATDRQAKERAELGEKAYSEKMRRMSLKKKKTKKKKYPSDATYPKLYPGNDAPLYPRS